MKKKFLTEKDTAKLLDVSPVTIERWKQQGKIPFKTIKDKIYFNKKEILDWAKEHDFTIPDMQTDQPASTESRFSLHKAVERGGIYDNVKGNDVYSVLENSIKKLPFFNSNQAQILLDELLKREEMASTAIGKGVAIPHPRTRLDLGLKEAHIALFFLQNPVDYHALDGKQVFVLFLLLTTNTKEHLKLLSKISHMLNDPAILSALQNKNKNQKLIEKIKNLENG